MRHKFLISLMIFLFLILSISNISAADTNTTDDINMVNDNGYVDCDVKSSNDNLLNANADEDLLSATLSFRSLENTISNSNGFINLTNDYQVTYYDNPYIFISNDNPLFIEGNGHTIDFNGKYARILSSGSNVIFNNITFKNSIESALSCYGSDCKITNCNFIECSSNSQAAALILGGNNCLIENTSFINNTAETIGAVAVIGSNNLFNNVTFINNSAYVCGGLGIGLGYPVSGNKVKNSKFINNSAIGGSSGHVINADNGGFAGGIFNSASGTVVENTLFEENRADYGSGGGFYTISCEDVLVNNCSFINNDGIYGGAMYLNGNRITVNNTNFYGNNAYDCAGTFMTGTNIVIANSTYENNHAVYGGGAITGNTYADSVIVNSTFKNNSAGNYGGALSIWQTTVDNSDFIDNSALFGGAVYTVNSTIKDSTFTNNNAPYGNSIFGVDQADVQSVIDESEVLDKHRKNIVFASDIQEGYFINLTNGYMGFCVEEFNTPPHTGIQTDNMTIIRNSLNHEDVSEYLKILFYVFIDHVDDVEKLNIQFLVWAFTNDDFRSSDNEEVRRTVELYDEGFRVNTKNAEKLLANGTLMVYDFSALVTPATEQNMFIFKYEYKNVTNQTVTKKALNESVFVGQEFRYEITVSNTGTEPLTDVFIEDKDFTSNMEFVRAINGTGNWTFMNDTVEIFKFNFNDLTKSDFRNVSARWVLNTPLLRGQNATIILVFKALKNGTAVNNVSSGFENLDMANNTNNDTRIYNPNYTVEKISLNETVELGQTAFFEIILRNTGDIALTNVFIEEKNVYDGLKYAGYHKDSLWNYSNVNGIHRWNLNKALPVNGVVGIIVFFNTTQYGNFTNIAVTGSNETDNKTANNTTKVLKPNLSVEKKALTPYVYVGNETTFEIVVKNTGEVNLDDIVVTENPQTGLEFVRANTGSIWQETEINGKKAWKLLLTLTPGSEEILFVTFKANRVGNYTNIVIASSNKTGNKTSNNTTVFNETVPDLPEDTANFTISKITIEESVLVGELVNFEIVVKNTGNKKLHNVTVYETKYDALKYVGYTDHFKMWIFDKDKMSWTLNSTFYPGEEVGFFVTFNTTSTGRYTNVVVVSSNETENKTDNDTIRVLKPGINIEKIAINKTVIKGEQVMFEILVHNIGEEPLDNVVVRELNFNGLIYDHFIDYTNYWVKNDDLSWSLNKVFAPGEYEGFFVVFNTIQKGEFTNIAVVESNDTDNDTDNDTVQVLEYSLSVSKSTLTPIVKLGQLTEFEITVMNDGDFDLENVFVVEDKYDSGLVYLNYISTNGMWKHSVNNDGKHVFTLNDLLKIGESASFRVIFNTTRIGNFTNIVSAGFNNTTLANSTNVTEVVKENVPNDNNSTETPDKKISKTTNETNESTKNSSNKIKTHLMNKNATGNPILALLFVLSVVPLRRFKK